MNPYQSMPREAFWRSGVAEQHPLTIENLYKKKFPIARSDRIATAGSCFAQHVANHLRTRGCNILDAEPPPEGLDEKSAKDFGFKIYSARYGNIYTARQLLQLLHDCASKTVRAGDIWEKNGRFYDALRPGVEPDGLASREEVKELRLHHFDRVDWLLKKTDLFIFTMGLTEAWVSRRTGTVYPTCPGVLAGEFDEARYVFKNFSYREIYEDFTEVIALLKNINPKIRILLTVSPIPLTATASGSHVLSATMYSKSTLRAVCGDLAEAHAEVDYFPSYEIIASPFSRGFFFEPNLRSVSNAGVEAVMRVFFSEHRFDDVRADEVSASPAKTEREVARQARQARRAARFSKDDLVCEERLLEAFGQ